MKEERQTEGKAKALKMEKEDKAWGERQTERGAEVSNMNRERERRMKTRG